MGTDSKECQEMPLMPTIINRKTPCESEPVFTWTISRFPANQYESILFFLELKHFSCINICVKFGVVFASPGNHLKTLTLSATLTGSHSHLWRIHLRHTFHSVDCLPCSFLQNYAIHLLHVYQGGPLQTCLRIVNVKLFEEVWFMS